MRLPWDEVPEDDNTHRKDPVKIGHACGGVEIETCRAKFASCFRPAQAEDVLKEACRMCRYR